MKGQKLSPKQEKFCLEYIKTGFAGEAYINAGYKANTKIIAEANARQLLEKHYIREKIQKLMDDLQSQKIASAEEVLKILTKCARQETQEDVVVVESVGDYMSEARIIQKGTSVKDAIKAAELLAKRWGILTEKISLDGDLSFDIKVDYGDAD